MTEKTHRTNERDQEKLLREKIDEKYENKIKELTEDKKTSQRERKEILQENTLLKKISEKDTDSANASKKKLYGVGVIAVFALAVFSYSEICSIVLFTWMYSSECILDVFFGNYFSLMKYPLPKQNIVVSAN